ncbi:MAG TPA: GNAT family N-acetyltransferase [Gaiellaceae bacterium]|nr:GNAT family N-acetyltransferase [Gaiellaceae bacterium]
MRLAPADALSMAELAALFSAGYEGYFVPVHVDEAAMRFMVESWDIDLSRSRVAAGVGVCNLGVRGNRGWIGGLAVVPGARRRGVGRALLEAVLEVAPPSVALEVLEQNEPALRLYEQLGFEAVRLLEVWSLQEAPYVEARSVEPAPLGSSGVPWQRADESLPPGCERVEVDGGAMVFRGGSVFQLRADDEDAAVALLSRGTALSFVNVPEGDVASRALRALGGSLDLRQIEMLRRQA